MAHNLLDVNDDCLVAIFEYLTDLQLADIASTCTRLETSARDVFSRRHNSNSVGIYIDMDTIPQRQWSAAILKSFGDLATKLIITFSCGAKVYNSFVFSLMVKYCTGTLETLDLRHTRYLQTHEIFDVAVLFGNVKELILDYSFSNDDSGPPNAAQINSPEFPSMNFAKCSSTDYLQLASLTLKNLTDKHQLDIKAFLKRCPNLTELEMLEVAVYDLSSIGEYCPALSKLTILGCDVFNITQLTQLDQLASLKLSIGEDDKYLKLLNTSKSSQTLDELMLLGCIADGGELLTALLRFTNLAQLSFTLDGVDDGALRDLQRQNKLRVLSIGGTVSVSITSDGLVDLVRNLPDLERLSLHLDCSHHCIQLQESTYLRIRNIYETRNQKLVIYNFDTSEDDLVKVEREEPFAKHNQKKFVRYISAIMRNNSLLVII